jgi:TIR domain
MAPKLFISYRRDDSAGHAGRVHDRLQREFGRDLLFMDVDSIPLGTNFVKVIADEVAKCDALLAIIGPGWLDARDEKGNRRLENPDDFVRIEIGTALKRGTRVIPVLLEGTRVPKADQLPDNLKELAFRTRLRSDMPRFPQTWTGLFAGSRVRRYPRSLLCPRLALAGLPVPQCSRFWS